MTLLLQVTEKIDAFMDNLQVGLELWEKQLMLGGEVDSWAGAKLALFAESHPFQQEQQVLDMRVRGTTLQKWAQNIHRHEVVTFIVLVDRMRSVPTRKMFHIFTRNPWKFKRCCRVRKRLWSCR